ncbi:MAG: ATP-binding cassette domain-containing protein [Planctomycetota bacterium]|jgi:ABC-2 type transport system ATP-binding protein
MTNKAIKINDLHFSYGRKKVLTGVDLGVPDGSIFGFLGRNGAGKTTLIKTLLGLQKPLAGKGTILGLDCFAHALDVRKRIGYMAEDQQMYGWMRVGQIINWVAGFYPNWDMKFTDELVDILRLTKSTKVKALSKGQNSSLALLLALGHHPELVILDDPTLGLDPIARKDFLRHVIDLLQSNNVTVKATMSRCSFPAICFMRSSRLPTTSPSSTTASFAKLEKRKTCATASANSCSVQSRMRIFPVLRGCWMSCTRVTVCR